MKERTKQWNWPITRVFDFNYTDFQPDATRRKTLLFATVQSRTAIFYAQIKSSEAFAGAGITSAVMYLADIEAITPITNLSAAFLASCADITPGPTIGTGGAIPKRELPSHPNNECVILNHDQGADLYLVLELDAAGVINNLTAGVGTVWFTYIRLR